MSGFYRAQILHDRTECNFSALIYFLRIPYLHLYIYMIIGTVLTVALRVL